MNAAAGAPPLGYRPNEPAPGKDSLEHPEGHEAAQGPTCPDCGLPFGEHPDFHLHGGRGLEDADPDEPADNLGA
jgi:hypothetical protein